MCGRLSCGTGGGVDHLEEPQPVEEEGGFVASLSGPVGGGENLDRFLICSNLSSFLLSFLLSVASCRACAANVS